MSPSKLYLRLLEKEPVDPRSGYSYNAYVGVFVNMTSESAPLYHRVGQFTVQDREWDLLRVDPKLEVLPNEWVCPRCNYMNKGVVCTHCGAPI